MTAPVSTIRPPVRDEREQRLVAPPPMVDRNPLVIGSGMTLAYISSTMRMATDGYREAFVDLLDELLERDPHGYSVLSKRVLAVAGGRVEIVAAVTEEKSADFAMAGEIASFVQAQFDALEDLPTTIASLLWGLYYGLAACEVEWERDGINWTVRALHFVHSRRLWYPQRSSWDLFISNGAYTNVDYAPMPGFSTKNPGLIGVRVEDFPGKFIIHQPRLRGDYVTREGLGRELAYWFALKGIGARGAAAYVEGYSRSKPLATYATGDEGKPRAASKEDIKAGKAAADALGAGSFSSGILPDSVTMALMRVDGGISHADWIGLCNSETSKAVLGQTGTTDIGKNGSRAQAETMREDQLAITRYDAMGIGVTLRKLARTLTVLNFPNFPKLVPKVIVHAVENPDPDKTMDRAEKGWKIGLPIDANKLGSHVALPLAKEGDPNARPLRAPPNPIDVAEANAKLAQQDPQKPAAARGKPAAEGDPPPPKETP
jgi:phage gp29-like protein